MKNKKIISVIITLYNEEESIPYLYSELSESLKEYKFEIIFINDGSSDTSKEVIQNIINSNNIHLIDLYKNYGKSAALSEGFKYAKGDYIITIDADLQVPNIKKFSKHTGWKPEITFEKTMIDLLNYWRKKIDDGQNYLTR